MYQIDFHHPLHLYFIGIGGISMSGLAEILLKENFKISGSDIHRSPLTESLEKKGAAIYYGQETSHLTPEIDLVVYTSAIHSDNPEFVAMKQLDLPRMSRADLLGQMMKNYKIPIAVSGTHGKTTTTSMISEILLENKSDPTLSIGGIYKAIGGNIRIGQSDFFVTEACEYTNSFLSLFPKISIILNIEEDHLDFFKDITEIRNSFHQFAALLPSDGVLIINRDIDRFEEFVEGLDCKIVTYGSSAGCDYRYKDLQTTGDSHILFTVAEKNGMQIPFSLSVPGEHNVTNAAAAIALAGELHISHEVVQKALLHFSGTDRRFEYKGTKNGITIIDDYAHHPTEIAATLNAARDLPHQKLWCIFQPHTYTRTKNFMNEFAQSLLLADRIILADIYAARETDTLGISSGDLCSKINTMGGSCTYLSSFNEIKNYVLQNCINGDLLITMGAGDIVKISNDLISD